MLIEDKSRIFVGGTGKVAELVEQASAATLNGFAEIDREDSVGVDVGAIEGSRDAGDAGECVYSSGIANWW